MLLLNNVEVTYANVILVLKGISLKVDTGQVIALLGANGAGKTTTLKAISGLLRTELGEVTRGYIQFDGCRIDRMDAEDIAKMGIIQVMEGRRNFEQLTIEENLKIGIEARMGNKDTKGSLEIVYRYFPRLKDLRDRTSGYLSGGEQQMLVIGRALMAAPQIMLLDEPSLGLAPKLVKEMFEIIRKINVEQRTAFLLVEQNVLAALAIADYGYVIENGRVVLDGSAGELVKNEDIREFYLGLGRRGERKSYREVKHYKRRKRWLG